MQQLNVYLNFPGTTAEAFRFYETVFGTRIAMIQTFGEASFVPNVPESAKKKIMHVDLPITETAHLMGSDAVEGLSPPLKEGNNFQISIVAKDKAKHPKNPVPTWNGDSIAYWDGDTLVVDTIGYNEKVPFIPATFHTPALHTIDRFRLINDGKQFEVRMTIDDPGAYTKVWETRVVSDRAKPGYKIRDYRCAENNRDLPAVGNWGPW